MKLCITGAGGYLGGVLVNHLARLPEVEQIFAVDLAPPSSPLPTKVRFVQMDVRSPDLSTVMAGCQAIVHTAFVVQWSARMPAHERLAINLDGTRNVAAAALVNGAQRLVYASSVAAYDPALAQGKSEIGEEFPLGRGLSSFYYANDKAAAERALLADLAGSNILLTCLRPHFIVGPGRVETVAALRQSRVAFRGHDPRLQFVHEADVASAFARALQTEMPGAYNVVPDDALRLSEIVEGFGEDRVRRVPLWLARLYLGITWRYAGSPTHPSWLGGILTDATASNARLVATGWAPGFTSREALRAASANVNV